MRTIAVETTIRATPAQVWAYVEDVGSHVEWMHDAAAITFTSERRQGVGTTFDCLTKVGPIRLTDRMEITAWDDARTMGVRHVGLVTGSGAFTLEPLGDRHTRFRWREELRFPWWLGGRVGERLGAPVLAAIWRRNLRELRAVVEARAGAAA